MLCIYFDTYLVVSFRSITYTVYSMNKTYDINKCTYSVECRRDSPPDVVVVVADSAADDDDDSLEEEEEKNRSKLGCLLQLLLLSAVLHIPTADNLEEVCCIYC